MKKDYLSVVYDERTPRTEYPFELAAYLSGRFSFKEGDKLLEIGCGRGEFLEAFKKLGLDCYGIDLSDRSTQSPGEDQIRKVDVSKDLLPYTDGSFDIVYHKSLIEHLYSPDNLMRETYRVLKPGGRVIILTPDWVSQMKVFYEDYTHSKPYNKVSLHDLLQVYGFSNVQTELFHQLPLVWKHPQIKVLTKVLQILISTPTARKVTEITGIKFFRWAVELMVLGTGIK